MNRQSKNRRRKLHRETRMEMKVTRGGRVSSHIVDLLREKLPEGVFAVLHENTLGNVKRNDNARLTRYQNRDNYNRMYERYMVSLVKKLIARGQLMTKEQYDVIVSVAVKRTREHLDKTEDRKSELRKKMIKRIEYAKKNRKTTG